jgi:hypothetical protein
MLILGIINLFVFIIRFNTFIDVTLKHNLTRSYTSEWRALIIRMVVLYLNWTLIQSYFKLVEVYIKWIINLVFLHFIFKSYNFVTVFLINQHHVSWIVLGIVYNHHLIYFIHFFLQLFLWFSILYLRKFLLSQIFRKVLLFLIPFIDKLFQFLDMMQVTYKPVNRWLLIFWTQVYNMQFL